MRQLLGNRRTAGLQPRWPDAVGARLVSRRMTGRRIRTVRRILAIALLVLAGALAVARQPPPSEGVKVVALTRDLSAGAVLRTSDLTVAVLTSIPDGALRSTSTAVGRELVGPARRGEVLTDARLVPSAGLDPGDGRVAVPIRPADGGTVSLLTPGMHVAVLSVAQDGSSTMLAPDAVVLDLPPPDDKTAGAKRLIVLAVPVAVADRVAAENAIGTLALRFT